MTEMMKAQRRRRDWLLRLVSTPCSNHFRRGVGSRLLQTSIEVYRSALSLAGVRSKSVCKPLITCTGRLVGLLVRHGSCWAYHLRPSDLFVAITDPHTAVAHFVAQRAAEQDTQSKTSVPMLVCSTAHFAKFPSAVLAALKGDYQYSGRSVSSTDSLEHLYSKLSDAAGGHPLNQLHERLNAVIREPVLHEDTCPADVDHISRLAMRFLCRT